MHGTTLLVPSTTHPAAPVHMHLTCGMRVHLHRDFLQDHEHVAAVATAGADSVSDSCEALLHYCWYSWLQDEEGVPEDRMFPISAVTGRGVREAVTAVRSVLDELGPAEVAPETDALNITEVPRRFAPEVRALPLSPVTVPEPGHWARQGHWARA
jgi:hypothetical protein